MGKTKQSRIGKVLVFFLIGLSVKVSSAEVGPGEIKPEQAKGRVPASISETYEKKTEGIFEAQGFGEDVPEPEKLREPQSLETELPEKEEVKDSGASADSSADVATVKQEEELNNELQLQRRVDVFYEGRVRLKNGAAIWATEDAGVTSPKLEITTNEEADLKSGSLRFRVFSNYLPFINKWELKIFKKEKLKSETTVELLSGTADDLYDIEFKFKEGDFKVGDTLFYQLKVFSKEGAFDIVKVKRVVFVERVENQNLTAANDKAEAGAIDEIFGQSSLEKQSIPIRGSRVRIVGNNLPPDHSVTYRGQSIAVNEFGKFLIEEHYPIGKHKILVDLADKEKDGKFTIPFNVDVSGKYFFVVGLADLRVGENKLSQKVADLEGNDAFDDSVFVDGRLAFFLKGKIQGKYLITSQLDTTEGDVTEIFQGLHRKNSESLFRRLDPDRFYPVYGDNSVTTEEAPTLGKFYVKVEVDQSYLLWGNANTNLSGTLFSQYNRTLYGGHLKYQSKAQTKFGEQKTKITGFVAEPETFFGHNEFLGTGGRQYILRHNDVVQGSEKVVLEVRDRVSGLLSKQIPLKFNIDYEIDYLAGRVILNQPINTFVLGASDGIINSGPVDNDTYHVVVDYEYNDTGDALDNLTFGGRLEQWLGSYVALGGTYVEEKRSNEEYNLQGVDVTLRAGQESFVKIESSKTESIQSRSNFISDNGGLNFIEKPFDANPENSSGKAFGIESQFFLNDFVDTKSEAVLTTWYRDLEAGFSTARRQTQNDLKEYGFDLQVDLDKKNFIKSNISISEEIGGSKEETRIASYGRRFKSGSSLSAEYRTDEIQRVNRPLEKGELIGLKWDQRINKNVSAYVTGQTTVGVEGGYEDNDRYALGTKFRIGRKWEGTTEVSDGDRGEGILAGVGYNVAQGHKVYANLDRSVNSTSGPLSNGITLGQRKSFKNGVRLTTENQFQENDLNESGVNQLYGLDYNLSRFFTTSFSYQLGTLRNDDTGAETEKSAVSAGLTYTRNRDITASTKISFVNNKGDAPLDQFLITNSLKFKVGPSKTLFFEVDYSITDQENADIDAARYTEANFGYAYRPVKNDRWNLFARYTYLYDLDSESQANARNDQKVHIASAEASYDLTRRWEIGGRLAQRVGSERITRGTGAFIDATLTFAQLRARYHLIKKWDGLFELRSVRVKETSDTQVGGLIGIDYHLGGNFKVGVGYNFTRFNDDLTNFSFDNRGWFLNVVGKL